MKIGILAVQGGVAEHERTLRQVAENYRDNSDSTWGDLEVILVRRAAHLEGINGLILPGGESTTMSRLLTLSGMDTLLKEALEAGLPFGLRGARYAAGCNLAERTGHRC